MPSQVKITGVTPFDGLKQRDFHYRNLQGKARRKCEEKIILTECITNGAMSFISTISIHDCSLYSIDVWIINVVHCYCMSNNLSSKQLTFLSIIETGLFRPLSFHDSLLSSQFVFPAALPPGIHITICFTPCCASVVCHATMKGTC